MGYSAVYQVVRMGIKWSRAIEKSVRNGINQIIHNKMVAFTLYIHLGYGMI